MLARLPLSVPLLALGLGLAGPCAAASSAAEPAVAGLRARLQLANGDQVTGELLWRADGKIRFRSAVLGDFTVAEADVAVMPLHEPLDPSAAARESAAATSATPPPRSDNSPTLASAPTAVGQSDETSAPPRPHWKGKVEFGYVQQSGPTDTLSYNTRAEAEKKTGADTYRATGRILYAEQNDNPSADRTDASARWRHELTRRAFSQTQTTYYRDDIIQIHTNVEQNVGVGYRIIDRPRHTANLGTGVTGQYREWSAGTNGIAAYAEVFQDYVFRINDRITFTQDAVAQYSPDDRAFNVPNSSTAGTVNTDEDNYKLRLNAALQGKVTERISVNFRFEYELDNAIQVEDARVTQRLTSSVGYAF